MTINSDKVDEVLNEARDHATAWLEADLTDRPTWATLAVAVALVEVADEIRLLREAYERDG